MLLPVTNEGKTQEKTASLSLSFSFFSEKILVSVTFSSTFSPTIDEIGPPCVNDPSTLDRRER